MCVCGLIVVCIAIDTCCTLGRRCYQHRTLLLVLPATLHRAVRLATFGTLVFPVVGSTDDAAGLGFGRLRMIDTRCAKMTAAAVTSPASASTSAPPATATVATSAAGMAPGVSSSSFGGSDGGWYRLHGWKSKSKMDGDLVMPISRGLSPWSNIFPRYIVARCFIFLRIPARP